MFALKHADGPFAAYTEALSWCTDMGKLARLQEATLDGAMPLLFRAQSADRLVHVNKDADFRADPDAMPLLKRIGRQGFFVMRCVVSLPPAGAIRRSYLCGLLHRSVAKDVVEALRRCSPQFRAYADEKRAVLPIAFTEEGSETVLTEGQLGDAAFAAKCAPLTDNLSVRLAKHVRDEFVLVECYDLDETRRLLLLESLESVLRYIRTTRA